MSVIYAVIDTNVIVSALITRRMDSPTIKVLSAIRDAGVVVDGVGYGTATCKKPAASWSVTVE